MWKIGNVEIENRVVLAPMAGICNSAFRKIVKQMGCGLIYAEMVSDKALFYQNKKTQDMLYMEEMERPIVQQIFGSDEESFVVAAKYIEETMHPDIIDINMGCPVPKVAVKAQAGASLLKHPEKVEKIVRAVVRAVSVPVTVKIRSGWDEKSINAVEIAQVCEKAGASAICIHGRTRSQGYSGKVNYDIIRAVKNAVAVPVIGNGDIVDMESLQKMLDTGVDAVMIGRGVLGNPWLIRDAVFYLDNIPLPPAPTPCEKIDMALLHLHNLQELKSEHLAVLEIRSHIAWYLKGLKNGKEIKEKIFRVSSTHDIIKILKEYKEFLKGEDKNE